MGIKKVVNGRVIAFDFNLDIMKSDLLNCLCAECRIKQLFIEIYTVEKNKISISQRLLQMGFDIVNISYKDGTQDIAIKMNVCELSVLLSTLSDYYFDEMTVWSANGRWEQHLFLKSAYKKICVENENDLYLCYNNSEKKVELYLNPNYDFEKINGLIKKYTVKKSI